MSTEQKMLNGEILYRDMDGFVYLNYLNSGKSGMNQMEYMNVKEAALQLCDIERNKTRETEEIQKSIKNKYDWLEKYLLTSNNRL